MNRCKHCCSQELVTLSLTHQNDFKLTSLEGNEYKGQGLYVPPFNVTNQSLEFTFCVACGQIMGKWRLRANNLIDQSKILDYHLC